MVSLKKIWCLRKRWYFFFFFPLLLQGQVALSDTLINFEWVFAGDTVSREITIENRSQRPVVIDTVCFKEQNFWALYPRILASREKGQITVFFSAEQNVDYQDFLCLKIKGQHRARVITCKANVCYSDSYYETTQNLWGEELKDALHDIIAPHTEYAYSQLWEILSDTDQDPANPERVILLYTGWSYAKTNHGGGASQWNREHVWAKSHGDFGTSAPAGTDVHHIRPTDVTVNSRRGSLDFDNGGEIYVDGDGVTQCRVDQDSWEPPDRVKGDVARMMYYMAVRYQGEEGYDLELVERVPSTTKKEPLFGKRSTLYQWHLLDAVDQWEKTRNERIYNHWQHNRNPFIDHPELVERLPSLSGKPLFQGPISAVFPSTITLDTVAQQDTIKGRFVLLNTGNKELLLSDIKVMIAGFEIISYPTKIDAEDYAYLNWSFITGKELGWKNGDITIMTNDPENPQYHLTFSAFVSDSVTRVEKVHRVPNKGDLTLYPNPVKQGRALHWRVVAPERDYRMRIFDVRGRVVSNSSARVGRNGAFNTHGWSSGVYWLQIVSRGGGMWIKKFVVVK